MADLFFIILFLAAFVTLIAALASALGGHGQRARHILSRMAIAGGVYLLIVLTVSWSTRPRTFLPGESKCNGEWCLAVAGVDRSPDGRTLTVRLRLSSTAKRVAMRENASVYLVDARGRHIEPHPDVAAVPLNVRLEAGEAAIAERVFDLRPDAGVPFLVVRFGGVAFPGCLVIGENAWLHEPDRMLLE